MGTDVNPVAWENAKIVSLILLENDKNDTLAKAYLSFVSNTDKGGSCGGSAGRQHFSCGGREYFMSSDEIKGQPMLDSLTKVIYETFYKHQS